MHNHQHEPDSQPASVQHLLRFGFILNLCFAILEVVIGLLSNSIAILTDAAHDFSDSASLFLALMASRVAERPPDNQRSFGYRRVSVLTALFNSSMLLVATGFIFYYAIKRILHPEPVTSGYMFLVAALSIAINGVAVLRMWRNRKKDLNLEGAAWHLLEDALGGLSILVGGIIIHFTAWYWVDPILSLLLGAFILRGALSVTSQAIHIFMEGTPPDINPIHVAQALLQHPAVAGVHHVHIWMLDSNHYNMSAHVRLHGPAPKDLYAELAAAVGKYKITHLTVQVERSDADLCQPPLDTACQLEKGLGQRNQH